MIDSLTRFLGPHPEAVATFLAGVAAFVVGIAAVIAAYRVGQRQTAIQTKQADILSRQLALQELTLKADLFERRYAVYAAVRDWLSFWEWERRLPAVVREPDQLPDQNEWDLRARFNRSIEESVFLFEPSVHGRLVRIRNDGHAWSRNKRMMDSPLGTTGRDDAFAADDGFIAEMEQHYRDLPDIFGRDMRLSDMISPDMVMKTEAGGSNP